jgi:GNAT superfamily N-acetyltransferase
MTCSINENPSVIYRPVKKHEQGQALDLWYSVFGADNPGCFERDFTIEASPNYQKGDTIGAWHDGQLVSAVHIRRIVLQSGDDDMKYLCGGISNVATLPIYRNQGFSRHLLRLAIERMEQSGEFDLSMLGTGRYNHYYVLGWEQINVPNTITIEWNNFDLNMNNIEWCSTSEIFLSDREFILALHTKNSRKYQFDRSPSTVFEHWVGWNWQLHQAIIYIYREKDSGYVVISKPNNVKDIYVSEWRASNVDVEKKLFKIAAEEIHRRQQGQTNIVRFHGLPQYMTINELEQWAGKTKIEPNEDMMIRNIRLPNETTNKIKTAYSKGAATFWPGDSF